MRNFGIHNVRASLTGKHSPARSRADTPRDSNLIRFPIPPRSLQGEFNEVQESQSRSDAFEFGARVFVIGCVCAVLFFFILFGAVINAFA